MKWVDVDGVPHITVGPRDRLTVLRMIQCYRQDFAAVVLMVECAHSGERAYRASTDCEGRFTDLYMGGSKADAFQAYEHAVKNKGAS